MLVEPGMYLLREIIMSEEASYSERMQALKLCLDRVVPVSLNLDATMTHKVPGWEAVVKGMFAAQQEPQAIEASADGPSLEDLTDAYNERGYVFQEDRRRHAARVLGWDVQSSEQLSASDVQTLLRDLQPFYSDPGIIEGEVLPEDRSNPPAAGARVSRAARVESADERLPSYVTDRERAGSARTYGRYN